ncbi:MAG: TaqI-like C-terminal specificity domain-containing protein [candidate division WOR-3 bacterium]
MFRSIRDRVADLPRLGELVTLTWGQERFNETNRRTIFSKATLPRGARIGKRFARFAPSSAIGCHAVDWSDCYVDADLYSRERKEQFARPKLVFGQTAPRVRAAFDDQGLYLGRSVFTTAVRAEVKLPLLTGLVNSRFGQFLLNAGESGVERGRRLEPEMLRSLPVALPTVPPLARIAKYLDTNVLRLVHIKRARHVIRQVWAHVAGFHAQSYAPLQQLLTNRLPGQKDAWVRKVVPSLAALSRRSRRFQGLRFAGDPEAPTLRVIAQADNGDEVVLAEAEFNDRKLMLFSCLATGGSKLRDRPATLRRILNDPIVPVVGPDVTSGARLVVDQLLTKVPKALAAEEIPAFELDVARVGHEIEQLESLVNAEVFRLYGLSWTQAQAVLDFLRVPSPERQKIETFFNRVTDSAATPS